MENKKKLFSPIITTIPDDMLVFSILNINEKITHKFIMENYINFYSFKVLNEEYVVLRFEDTMNRKKYEGIDHCFIPIDLLEKYDQNFNIIIEMIREGYFLTLPICKKDISFYEELEGTHLITIYDADVSKNIFLCKDFQGHKFVEFEVPFKDIKNGLLNYHRIYQKDSEGLTALRLTNKCNTKIDYSKMFLEFWKLQQNFCTDTTGFGIGALNLVAKNIEERYDDFFKASEWYNPVNYLREASKLMNIRYNIFREEFEGGKNTDGSRMLEKLEKDTAKIFFNVEKKIYNGKELTKEELEKFYYLFLECKEDFRNIAELFCDKIEKYLK